jgi:response regulator RpfG family c-di-GMP phosphodiesterase
MRKVVLFNEDKQEREKIFGHLSSEELTVFETSRILELMHLLKTEDINVVIASQGLGESDSAELRKLVGFIKPDIEVLFVSPLMNGKDSLSIDPDEFRHFLQNTIRTESHLTSSLASFRDFFLAFSERLLQIFSADRKNLFNKDYLVARLSRKTAVNMELGDEMSDTIQIAALLRDLGMMAIHHQLLEERRKFTSSELVSIKKHPINTVHILEQINFPWNVESIILQHHENYDGSGYPMGLKGRQISIGARIVHIADSFVAMTSRRSYGKTLSREEAVHEMTREAGTKYDPEVVEVFQSVINGELSSGEKRSILIVDRDQRNIIPLIKIGTNMDEYEIFTSNNGHEAIYKIKNIVPDLIIADIEMLHHNTSVYFLNAFYEMPAIQECSFIFVLPDDDYPRNFKGENVRYLVKPVDIEDFSSTIKTLLHKETETRMPARPRGLSGSIEDFDLADIIQILNLGLKTAKVEIEKDQRKGVLYLDHGNVVHASAGKLTGKSALFEMMRWDAGNFHIQHGLTTRDVNISSEMIHLLLESARVQDELDGRVPRQ